MELQIKAILVFSYSPQDQEGQNVVDEIRQYYDTVFCAIGFRCQILETTHYDEGNLFYPEAAALDVQLTTQEFEFPTLYNLLKIAEASLLLFPRKMSVNDFCFEIS